MVVPENPASSPRLYDEIVAATPYVPGSQSGCVMVSPKNVHPAPTLLYARIVRKPVVALCAMTNNLNVFTPAMVMADVNESGIDSMSSNGVNVSTPTLRV